MARGPLWTALTTAAKPTIDSASWNTIHAAAPGVPLYASLPTPTKRFIDQPAWDALVTSVPDTFEGSTSITFGTISDGAVATSTITVTGAVTTRPVAPRWPPTLPAGIIGMMFVSAADTVTVRLLNMSGGDVTLGALAFGAMTL